MSGKAEDHVAIRNIYYMMAYAYGSITPGMNRDYGLEDFDHLLDLMSVILARALQSQRRRGFERDYFSVTEPVGLVRGRIGMHGTMTLRARGSVDVECTYDEYTDDTYMNRIIKTTASYLISAPDNEVDSANKSILKNLLPFLDSVELLDIHNIDWNRIRHHRNNGSYRFLMAVCYMVLKGKLLSEIANREIRSADLLDSQALYALFEKFVLNYYKFHHKELHPDAPCVSSGIEDAPAILPGLYTDIVLTGSQTVLIIDTKCYGKILSTQYEKDILCPAHRNQIFGYVMHGADKWPTKSVSGMLLYALTDRDEELSTSWKELNHGFCVRTLDLSQPFEAIASQLEAIASTVA